MKESDIQNTILSNKRRTAISLGDSRSSLLVLVFCCDSFDFDDGIFR